MDTDQLQSLRLRLETERAEANRRIADRQMDAERAVDPSESEVEVQAVQSHEADVALTFAERETERYAAIAAALERIARGEYGVCLDCDEEIPAARLEIEPTALRCTDCQSRQEAGRPPTL